MKGIATVAKAAISDVTTVILMVAVLFVFGMATFAIYRNVNEAAKTHDALCSLKNSRIIQRDRSLEFLRLTKEERIEKYGPAIGSIPDSAIQQGVDDNTQLIAALRQLSCPPPPPH